MSKIANVLGSMVLALALSSCASGYKTYYTAQPGATPETIAAKRVAPPPATPIIERAKPPENPQDIYDAYMKRGYVPLGYSSFNSGKAESEDSAVRQGQDVGADLVLIINPKYTGSITTNMPITTPTTTTSYSTGTATAYGSGGSATAYGSGTTTTYGTATNYVPVTVHRTDFGAICFVKIKFNLGAFPRDLNDAERQELQSNKGVVVRFVVDGSPAFNADILAGDIITAIDGVTVPAANSFSELLAARKGKLIKLSILRHGQHIEKSVQLNTDV